MSDVALLMQSAVNGGVQRVMINLAEGLINHGFSVDFLICDATGEMLQIIPKECNIIDFGKRKYRGDIKVVASLPSIISYMKKNQKTVLIGAPGLSGSLLAFGKLLSKQSKVIAIFDNKVSLLKDGTLYHNLVYQFNKIFIKKANVIVAAHRAAGNDIIDNYNLPDKKVKVIYHPLISKEKIQNAIPEKEHKYIGQNGKLLLSVGRLVAEKDFANLINAFDIVRRKNECRLIILGDGPERQMLADLINAKKLNQYIDLYGYTNKVYDFMKAADALILSSKEEAFGNVLVEALACGIPIVTTDCASGGPRDIIDNKNCMKYGAICECSNPTALASAIETVINNYYDKGVLSKRAEQFTIDYSVSEYIKAIKELM